MDRSAGAGSGADAARRAEVLAFWLDEVGPKGWFTADPAVDRACNARFGVLVEDAVAGRLDGWAETAEGALALTILLDQLPRNIHRGAAAAFAGDARALRIVRNAIAAGHDLATPAPARLMFYLVLEHSEDLADQDLAVALIAERLPEAAHELRHAQLHRDLILRFGRFPHRNAALGRESTADERAHLESGGYAPGAQAKRPR